MSNQHIAHGKRYYVTMTDEALSGWGRAEGKTNKLTLECDSLEEAHIVKQNATDRSDMIDIEILDHAPQYNDNIVYESRHDKSEYATWYRADRPFQ